MNITIILTSTVYINTKKSHLYQTDPNERIQTYIKSVLQWINNTNFNIVLVENSGYLCPLLSTITFIVVAVFFSVVTSC